jgi:uncharacterized protein (TIGR00730 family)
MSIQSIVVFCGSKAGNNEAYINDAKAVGKVLAEHNITLIYGAGNKGIMGAVANAVLDNNGKAVGIIPTLLQEQEHMHLQLTETFVVEDMHVRKKMLYEKADAAMILPGGHGTMDELFEMLTWNNLKIHEKKIFLVNSAGFYNNLIAHMNTMYKEGFLYCNPIDEITVLQNPAEITKHLQ